MVVIAKSFLKAGNAATRRQLTYEEFIESYKQYKVEKSKLIDQAK